MVGDNIFARAAIELDHLILDPLLQRQHARIDENSMAGFISRLVCGSVPQGIGQEIRQLMREPDRLEHRKPDLEKLLELHQRSLGGKSPFSIMPTCRYTLAPEASVVALEDIKANVPIPELLGFLVPLSKDIIEKLEAEEKTNSVIEVKGAPHLLIGPVSRVNHDCHPNSEFTPQLKVPGQALTVRVTAKRRILNGEEITVSYSNHYFGENNKDCMCSTCEVVRHNGWRSTARAGPPFPEQDGGRVTRKTAKQRKRETLGQMIYSYRALNDGLTERWRQDYHYRIPKSKICRCSVCKMRVAYSLVSHLCASCRLRAALGDYIQGNTMLKGSSKKNHVGHRAQQELPNLYGAYGHARIYDNPERKIEKGKKLGNRKTRAGTRRSSGRNTKK